MIEFLKNVFVNYRYSIQQNRKLFRLILPRTKGIETYTVVTAVYNVENYLDDYFWSLVHQRLRFAEHIRLILVDDGSTDGSAAVIEKWRRKYPKNIVYVRQENGGQASARNHGLQYVETEWVTFIDADDFVDRHYFLAVDTALQNESAGKVCMVSCPQIFYQEDKGVFEDTHPLKYRFQAGQKRVRADDGKWTIQLAVNDAFFRMSLLENMALRFDTRIRPNFEDGHFVNRYLLEYRDNDVIFLPDAKYYYRKRSDGSSTLDGSWKDRNRFTKVLEYGYLDLCRRALEKSGSVPLFLQRTLLYELVWHFKFVTEANPLLVQVEPDVQERYISLLRAVLRHIDLKTILQFELAGADEKIKIGMVGFGKGEAVDGANVFFERYDEARGEVKLYFYTYTHSPEVTIRVNDAVTAPVETKPCRHTFLGEPFCCETIVRFRAAVDDRVEVAVNDEKKRWYAAETTDVTVRALTEKAYPSLDGMRLPWIVKLHRKISAAGFVQKRYEEAWLFLDRDTRADDNAEHLYRYVRRKHPQKKCFFLLRKDSPDWDRLEKEGFELIAFGSLQHTFALQHASFIISSHANGYTTDYLPRRFYGDRMNSRFVFLQHGVTGNDISSWLNPKKIDCLIAAGKREYDAFVKTEAYRLSSRDVALCGFPRHDALLAGANETRQTILVMPTWRAWLVGKSTGKGDRREINADFYDSDYAKRWRAFFNDTRLKELLERFGYTLRFIPHPNIEPYMDWFDLPVWVQADCSKVRSIQQCFRQSAFLVTDYSSVAFEMAIQEKQTLYYQFDREEALGGKHTAKQGYFDYEADGFGPVCPTDDTLFSAVEALLAREGAALPEYRERMRSFFAYHDTNNARRVYDAIVALEAGK